MGTGANLRGKPFGATRIDSVPMFRMSVAVLCSPVMVWTENFAFFSIVFSLKLVSILNILISFLHPRNTLFTLQGFLHELKFRYKKPQTLRVWR
jgi:hypothetical protein